MQQCLFWSLAIGNMPGADEGGYAGFHDRVDTHFWVKIGNALLITITGAAAQLSQPQAGRGEDFSPTQILAGEVVVTGIASVIDGDTAPNRAANRWRRISAAATPFARIQAKVAGMA